MRRALLAFLFIIPFMQAHAQGIDRDAYLGVWETANKYDQIEVVKTGRALLCDRVRPDQARAFFQR